MAQPRSELDYVPGDTAIFVHVRLAEIWKSEAAKDLRAFLAKAGPKAIEAFDRRFVPTPSSVERITVFMLMRSVDKDQPPQPEPLIVFRTNQAVPTEQLLKSAMPKAVRKKAPRGEWFDDVDTRTGLAFLDANTFFIGESPTVEAFLTARPKPDGPMAAAVAIAANKPLTIALNPSLIPPSELESVPLPFRPLFAAKLAYVTLELTQGAKLEAVLRYADASARSEAQDALKGVMVLAKQGLVEFLKPQLEAQVFGDPKRVGPSPLEELPEAALALLGLAAIEEVKQLLERLPITARGNELAFSVQVNSTPLSMMLASTSIGIGLLLPAVQKVREAATRMTSMNNLKQLALAFHNYESAYGKFPNLANVDKTGKPLLSWRVHLLPFLEQEDLYRQFKLDEPWDSEHNKKLIPLMPKVFANPRLPTEPGYTTYQAFAGTDTAMLLRGARNFQNITDGTSVTILFIESSDPVIWTKPEDIPYDPKKPLPDLGRKFRNAVNAAMCDGSVRALNLAAIKEASLRAAITANDGLPVDLP